MHEYDTALKCVLQRLTGTMMEQVTGFAVTRWLNVELPEVRSPRVDLLGETARGELVHIELQSTNEPDMALRMAEYALAICRRYGRMPSQVVLYVGLLPLNMKKRLEGPHLSFECRLVDIRDMDGDRWLASDRLDDNIIAVLMRFQDQQNAIKTILGRIAAASLPDRPRAMAELLILAALRRMGDIIRREANQMPLLNDIMDDEVFGPVMRQGMEVGRREGRTEGRTEGQRYLVLRQLTQRFGTLPDWAKKHVETMPAADLDAIAIRLLEADNLSNLLRS